MKTQKTILIVLLSIAGLMAFIFHIIYFTHKEMMPYHAAAIGLEWDKVQPEVKPLILALMKESSLYFLSVFLLILTTILLFIFNKNPYFKFLFSGIVSLVGLVSSLFMLYIVYSFLHNCSITYPIYLSAATCLIFLSCFILSFNLIKKNATDLQIKKC